MARLEFKAERRNLVHPRNPLLLPIGACLSKKRSYHSLTFYSRVRYRDKHLIWRNRSEVAIVTLISDVAEVPEVAV